MRSIILRSTPNIFATRIFAASLSRFCSLRLSLLFLSWLSLEKADISEICDEKLMGNFHVGLLLNAKMIDACSEESQPKLPETRVEREDAFGRVGLTSPFSEICFINIVRYEQHAYIYIYITRVYEYQHIHNSLDCRECTSAVKLMSQVLRDNQQEAPNFRQRVVDDPKPLKVYRPLPWPPNHSVSRSSRLPLPPTC